jgi:bifunctional NMN adenylyltransferase/nudix hydrolase
MKNYQYKTAIYIGRMQPIHLAHLDTIKEALNMAEKLIIVIGSYNKAQSIKNPFTYNHRVTIAKDAIKEYFGEPLNQPWSDTPSPSILDRIVFVPVRDYMYNDYKWSSEVYSKCVANGATEHKTTILIG